MKSALRAKAKRSPKLNGHLSVYSGETRFARDTFEHEARLVLTRTDEDWGEAVFAIRIAPFARDVAQHLDEVTLDDLAALCALGRAAARELKKRNHNERTNQSSRRTFSPS